ncbi:probable tetraacyldisaccharide 4'-kinase, mitochondrial isoform X3 [Malania oleifera]|uniref:probable tetraacyldisaccharide 4'-kinase, mitochondrial isoform X3 n=1 Tax=Malania oleifera TaxID=397392 RepID=UPI0025AE17DB|nr:probable tetraacyldisaccharide 4'-kinase, mitochondrial isoform X3 [Malania oleifera]
MEKLRKLVNEIAYTSLSSSHKLSPLQRSVIPFLSIASSLYRLALSLRRQLYYSGIFRRRRLPVPVISVGNLTWGGNGKTPMVESIALFLADSGISPLILTRGYACGDEANMLQRHLLGTSARIGVGANRFATAACFLERYGYVDPRNGVSFDRPCIDQEVELHLNSEKVGAVILDDGMQHLSLWRDLEIAMINGLMPWGNCQLVPLGPLREPLTALERADVAVVHHADLAVEQNLKDIELMIREVNESIPIFFSRMSPSYFFTAVDINLKIPLKAVCNRVVLCVSAIGFSDAFVQGVGKIGPSFVDRLDFSDHHLFQDKDYDRDPEILKHLDPFEVLVLCSQLQIISGQGNTEESLRKVFKQLLKVI